MTAALTPLWALLFDHKSLFSLSLCLAFIIFWRHKENIHRLIRSQESKIGRK